MDKYCVDLARSSLAKAEANMLMAQEYMFNGGGGQEIKRAQRSINAIRNQSDRLLNIAKVKKPSAFEG